MDNSCYGCTDRKVGCHSKCEKYKAYKEKHDAINAKMAHERYMDNLLDGKKIENRVRKKHRQQKKGVRW